MCIRACLRKCMLAGSAFAIAFAYITQLTQCGASSFFFNSSIQCTTLLAVVVVDVVVVAHRHNIIHSHLLSLASLSASNALSQLVETASDALLCFACLALPAFAAHSPQRTGCDCLSACPSHSYSHSPKTAFGLISRLFGFVWFGFSALAQRCCCSAPSLNSSWLLACVVGLTSDRPLPVLFVDVAIAVAG